MSGQPLQYKENLGNSLWHTKLNAGLDALWDADTAFTNTIADLSTLINNWAIEDQIVTLIPVTCTYSDNNTFTITGDYTSRFAIGAVVQVHVAAGMVYSTVASSTYAAPTTTVNLADAVLTDPITRLYVVATRDGLWPFGPGYIVAEDYAGGTYDETTLAAADAVATAAGKQLLIGHAYTLTGDLTLSANVKIMPGAVLTIATTKTLTINGTLDAGIYQIFSCTGTGEVVFGTVSVKEVYPQWWGAIGDDSTDCTTAINAATKASNVVHIKAGIYQISGTIYLGGGVFPNAPSNYHIKGDGPNSIIKLIPIDTTAMILGNYSTVKDLTIQGPYDSPPYAATNARMIQAAYWGAETYPNRIHNNPTKWTGYECRIERVTIKDSGYSAIDLGPNSVVTDCLIDGSNNEGIWVIGSYCIVSNNIFRDTFGWAIDSNASDVQITNNQIINCGDASGHAGHSDMGGIVVSAEPGYPGGLSNIIISNNLIDTSDGIGISIVGDSTGGGDYSVVDVLISNNLLRNVCKERSTWVGGIACVDSTTANISLRRISITGNVIDTVGSTTDALYINSGIKVVFCDGTVINSNVVKGATLHAIEVSSSKDITVGNNTISTWGSNLGLVTNAISYSNNNNGTITNNTISPGVNTTGLLGIIAATTCTDLVVNSNSIIGTSAAIGWVTVYKGIRLDGTSGNLVISNNKIIGCIIGIESNAGYTYSLVSITGNFVFGCTTAMTLGGTFSGLLTTNNNGYPPALGVPASTVELRNTYAFPCRIKIIGGTVTVIAKGPTSGALTTTGITLTSGVSSTVVLQPQEYIAITYSVAPTWEWVGE